LRRIGWWLGAVWFMLLGSGCAGVIYEARHEDGNVQRLKVDGGESWSAYEDKPRYPQSRIKDEYSIWLKKEATF